MGKGGMSLQFKCARLVMIFVNVLIFLIGATLIGEGTDLMLHPHFSSVKLFLNIFENLTNSKRSVFPPELIILTMILPGFILVSIGFCGCSGAITQLQCILHYYASIIGILLCFQTFLFVLLLCFRSTFFNYLFSRITSKIHHDYQGPLSKTSSPSSLLLDFTMFRLKCCGLMSEEDFAVSTQWDRTNLWWDSSMPMEAQYFTYPLTCCPIDEYINENRMSLERTLNCAINGSALYRTPCGQRIINGVMAASRPILIGIFLLYSIEIFILMFVFVIYQRNRVIIDTLVIEDLPPLYSSRTRVNRAHVYFQI